MALSAGISPVTGEFPSRRPVTRSFDIFFDLRLNKRLSKQSWGWWFEGPSRSLWRHCNDHVRCCICALTTSSKQEPSLSFYGAWCINMFIKYNIYTDLIGIWLYTHIYIYIYIYIYFLSAETPGVIELDVLVLRLWLVAGSTQSHCRKQCWRIIYWPLAVIHC